MKQEHRLLALAAHTRKWSPRINLVSKSSLVEIENRHIKDSTQLASFIPNKKSRIIDLGCGGGFPGLALACLGYENLTLVDSDARKISACRAFLREQALSVNLVNSRIDELQVMNFEIVTARALASLDQLLQWAVNLLSTNGRCLFLKGARVDEEIDSALKIAEFTFTKHPSLSSPDGCVLEICNVRIRS